MMKISKLADYATLLMTCMARMPTQRYSSQALALESKVQLPTVGKILKRLTQAGLLCSQRGSHGGYKLARAIEAISLADIVAAIDGHIALTECARGDHHCEIESFCNIGHNWQFINRVINTALSSVTLADMLKHQEISALNRALTPYPVVVHFDKRKES